MRKKLTIFFSLTAIVLAFFMSAGIYAAKTDRVSADSIVTKSELVENYYQRVTMQKDGTGTGNDSKTFGGLVPYGTGKIELGTYDMSDFFGLEKPLFTIVPHKEWKTVGSTLGSTDNLFFNVNLQIGSKSITYRFANQGRTDGYNIPCVYIGNTGGTYGAQGNWSKDDPLYPNTILPYNYDGTQPAAKAEDEEKAEITAPQEIGFYCNGYWFMDAGHSKAYKKETAENSGIWRTYLSCIYWNQPKEAELKNVSVSIEFDKGSVTQDEAWVTFTSIGSRKFTEEKANHEADVLAKKNELLRSNGDLFALNETTTTITLNKQIYLGDNDATTKLFEFESTPISRDAEISQVVLIMKGGARTFKVAYIKGDQGGMQNVVSTYTSASPWDYWYIYGRDNKWKDNGVLANLVNHWGRQSPYFFDGAVSHAVLNEKGTAYVKGSVETPRFAIYYDAATDVFYNDFGKEEEKVAFGDVYRWPFIDCTKKDGLATGINEIKNMPVDVTIEVTLADGVESSYIKLTNVDGQSLTREGVMSANYSETYHSYMVKMDDVKTENVFVGSAYKIPELKDYGVLSQFASADKSAYTVKVNGNEVGGSEFDVDTAGENTIGYVVDSTTVEEISFTAVDLGVSLIHFGASIRYIGTDEYENGIRYMVAMKATDVDKLDGYTVTSGILVAGTDMLDGEMLSADTLADAYKKAQNVTFDLQTEWTKVTIENVEYIQMVVYVYNIPDTDYGTEVTTRGYLCVNGTYIYSTEESRSMSYVAQKCIEDPNVSQELKDAVRKYVVS